MHWLQSIFGNRNKEQQPTIGRKSVIKAYKDTIVPLLRSNGFKIFRGSTAWRHSEKRIDVVELEFFPRDKGRQWGITPVSFALPVGCFFPFVPSLVEPKIKKEGDLVLPKEINCHIRRTTDRRLRQRQTKIPNIWYVKPNGSNLQDTMDDARTVLLEEGLPWFDHFSDLNLLLESLLKDEGNSLPAGTHGTPKHLIAFLALELKRWQLAYRILDDALASGFYTKESGFAYPIDDKIRAALAQAKSHL